MPMRRGPKPAKSKEAKPPVARKAPKDDAARVRDLEKRLAEAEEQQTATAEILRVISGSPGDLQPVLDAVAENAARVCSATDARILRVEGDKLRRVAQFGPLPAEMPALIPLSREFPPGRSIIDRRTLHIEDLRPLLDTEFSATRALRTADLGIRTMLVTPLMRENKSIGAILIRRTEVRPFTDKQIALLQTFADQAVIAIENVRLFQELQASNRELTTALDKQTATSDILRVISRSQMDVRPVFDAILASAIRLLNGYTGALTRREGDQITLAALTSTDDASDAAVKAAFPQRLHSRGAHPQTIRDRVPFNVADAHNDARLGVPEGDYASVRGYRSLVVVPLLRHDEAIGTVSVTRREPGGFTNDEIALLQTFADQAVIAIENVRLFRELQTRNRDLTEALDRQTATAEVLRVISSSPTDLQPVFDVITRSAVTLCGGVQGGLHLLEGELLLDTAAFNLRPEALDVFHRAFPMRLHRGSISARAIMDRAVQNVPDIEALTEYTLGEYARAAGFRSTLAVPMFREGVAIGVIVVARPQVGPFSEREVELLKTFASQAVIAIENVRLFKELEEKNRALTQAHAQVSEALEQQTATSEILRVISLSPTDVQPVFDAIAERSLRLCGGLFSSVYRFDGELIHMVAHHNYPPMALERSRQLFPTRPGRHLFTARAILERSVVLVADVLSDPEWEAHDVARAAGFRSVLAVPMLRGDDPIGAIVVWHTDVGPFSEKHITLLTTFADQAVIAIENVRLFTELQEKNRALMAAHTQVTEALDQQTATAEILRVISSSPTDVQPVFEAIVQSAVGLCKGFFGAVFRYEDVVSLVATCNVPQEGLKELRRIYPGPPAADTAPGRALLTRAVVHIHDQANNEEFSGTVARASGYRTNIAVPMLRNGQPIGAIAVARSEVQPFSETEIQLLKTFADQAVIAIENARLFNELQARTTELIRSVDELTALGDVGHALSSTLDLEAVLQTIVTRATQLTGTAGCVMWEYDQRSEEFRLRANHYAEGTDSAILPARGGVTTIPRGQGLTTQVMEERQAVQIPDITVEGAYESPVRKALIDAGHRALLGVPLLSEDEVIGVLAVTRKTSGEFESETVRLLSTFAAQSSLALQNARLFREIEQKSRELEAASRHKSEFLANMSHELRTPLNAIIGFSEVLNERMFGELNEKQDEYLKDIYASGQHLLSVINDILDLSKVEAGRMELEATDFDLPTAIDNALILVRERASRRGITLGRGIDGGVGMVRGDERKVKQVLLNLLSNALKFTREGGRVDVRATMKDGMAEISVADTGVGIAPEDQEAIFEEFRQVGTADKKVEGTGLGLALSRKFIELHGGRIWVHSQPGKGSTFSFTLPAS